MSASVGPPPGSSPPPGGSSGSEPAVQWLPVVQFKLRDSVSVPDANLPIASLLPSHSPVLSFAGTLAAESLHEPDTLARLDRLAERAGRVTPGYQPPRFRNVLRVRTDTVEHAHLLADALRTVAVVEFAEVQRLVRLPAVQPNNDPLYPRQRQHKPPGLGVNADAAWIAGADGAGVSIVDLERGFDVHNALPAIHVVYRVNATPTNLSGDHGTAVLGILCERDDSMGGVGLAPAARVGFVARFGPTVNDDHLGDALTAAAGWLGYGDVLLLEQQDTASVWSAAGNAFIDVLAPLEVLSLVSSVYLPLLRALGIIVVEPAGNGSQDLAGFGAMPIEDSGAIIVGGVSGTSGFRSDNDYMSNFGSRVNCHALYSEIVTTGYLADLCNLDPRYSPRNAVCPLPGFPGSGTWHSATAYTWSFEGTSAASATVAGAACLLQSHVVKKLGYRLSPEQMRDYLSTHGVAGSAADRVGVMPDLGACIQAVEQPSHLWLRAYPGDTGALPRQEWGASPDILIYPELRADGPPWDRPMVKLRQLIRVQAANSGPTPATGVSARVYASPWSEGGAFQWTELGRAWIGDVRNDGAFHKSEAPLVTFPRSLMTSTAIMAIVESMHEPGPHPEGIRSSEELERFFVSNRQVGVLLIPALVWRPPERYMTFQFDLFPPFAQQRDWMEVDHRLPPDIRVRLTVPSAFARDPAANGEEVVRVDVPAGAPFRLDLRPGPPQPAQCSIELAPLAGDLPLGGAQVLVTRHSGDRPLRRIRCTVPEPDPMGRHRPPSPLARFWRSLTGGDG